MGERPGHGFACKMAQGTEAERRYVLTASGVEPPQPSLKLPSLTDALRRLKQVKACPHLVEPECACNFGRCSLYDRPTSYPECIDCGGYDATKKLTR